MTIQSTADEIFDLRTDYFDKLEQFELSQKDKKERELGRLSGSLVHHEEMAEKNKAYSVFLENMSMRISAISSVIDLAAAASLIVRPEGVAIRHVARLIFQGLIGVGRATGQINVEWIAKKFFSDPAAQSIVQVTLGIGLTLATSYAGNGLDGLSGIFKNVFIAKNVFENAAKGVVAFKLAKLFSETSECEQESIRRTSNATAAKKEYDDASSAWQQATERVDKTLSEPMKRAQNDARFNQIIISMNN